MRGSILKLGYFVYPFFPRLTFDRRTGGTHWIEKCAVALLCHTYFFVSPNIYQIDFWSGDRWTALQEKNCAAQLCPTIFLSITFRLSLDRETDGNAIHVKTLPRSLSLCFPFFFIKLTFDRETNILQFFLVVFIWNKMQPSPTKSKQKSKSSFDWK